MGATQNAPTGEQSKGPDCDHERDDARQHRLSRSPEKDGRENGPAEERVNRFRVKPRDTRPVLSVDELAEIRQHEVDARLVPAKDNVTNDGNDLL